MKNAFTKEWIITNGIGGYASGTIQGANTRRYHGLLVASFMPPTDRKVLVAKIEERIFSNDNYYDLSINQYPRVIYPNGDQYLKKHKIAPFPYWYYESENWKLEKSIFMVQNNNCTLVNYVNKSKKSIILELHPLYSYNDYHSLFHENNLTDFYTEVVKNHIKTYACYGSSPIFTRWNSGDFIEARSWYKNIELPAEDNRGLDFIADYYRIGYIKHELQPNEQLTIQFTTDEALLGKNLTSLIVTEKARLNKIVTTKIKNGFYGDLLRAGRQFLVNRKSTNSLSIIAGYHWFSDWGRDTMISMRGLTIATGHKTASKSILSTFFKSVNQGMIPNRFPDHNEDKIDYNTMDATLWLFVALYEYYIKFEDLNFVKKQFKKLQEILDWHIKGTHYNIHVTPEGFLFGGKEGVQLTWMDAIVNGEVITPRMGCPIEINALWYNALKTQEYFCERLKVDFENRYSQILINFENNFANSYINNEGTLYDVIVPNISVDNSFRSNQLYCLSLPFSLLKLDQKKTIFKAITDKLLTPFGLRTLDQQNSNFKGNYCGNQWQRDHAYHQGTVWPYLLSEYYTAFFKIYGATLKNKRKVIAQLETIKTHFYSEEGLHCISEVFDGTNPTQGKGTIHQAWSVGAMIKLYSDYKLYEIDEA